MPDERNIMRVFDYSRFAEECWDSEILRLVAKIHECKGRQELLIRQKPAELDRLVEIARIQSTEASNKIEGIVTTSTRMHQLINEKLSRETGMSRRYLVIVMFLKQYMRIMNTFR